MTTVKDASGLSPEIFYNRSGQTIEFFSVVGGTGTIAPVTSFSGKTICFCNVSGSVTPMPEGLELPVNAEVGDVVQVCQDAAFSRQFTVYAPVGESINTYPSFPVGQSLQFIKVSATDWVVA
jgi:hypothetical protein